MDRPNAGFDYVSACQHATAWQSFKGIVSFDLIFDEQHVKTVSSMSANALALMLLKHKKCFGPVLVSIVRIV